MPGLDTLIKSFQYTKKKEKKIKTQGSDIVPEEKILNFFIFCQKVVLFYSIR